MAAVGTRLNANPPSIAAERDYRHTAAPRSPNGAVEYDSSFLENVRADEPELAERLRLEPVELDDRTPESTFRLGRPDSACIYSQPEAVVPVSDLDRALSFYVDTMGLELVERLDLPQTPMARLSTGNGTLTLYKSVGAGESRHTIMGFNVDDIESAVEELRGRGVTFEEYDMGEIKTEKGIARLGDIAGAWFKDPDGNILSMSEYGART